MRVSSCFFKRSYTLTTVAFPSILPSPLSLPSTGMSESETPNPIPQDPAAVSSELSDDSIQPDPLLGSGSFIDPDRNESRPESPEHQQTEVDRTVEFGLDTVIDAKPISMLAPADNFAEAVPRPPMRRNPEEMAKKPSWLPDDWKIELRVRSSGATAGTIDRYYVEPSGKHKFRSKNEVLHFLETGSKLKRKLNSDTDAGPPSGTSVSQKQKKSSIKRKKSEAVK